jgi:hypothetical protein
MFADEPPFRGVGGQKKQEINFGLELKTKKLLCGSYLKDIRIYRYA